MNDLVLVMMAFSVPFFGLAGAFAGYQHAKRKVLMLAVSMNREEIGLEGLEIKLRFINVL